MTPSSERATHRTRVRSVRVTLTPDDAAILRRLLGPTLSRDDAASIAGVTRRTVDRWRKQGAIVTLASEQVGTWTPPRVREIVVLDTDSVLAMITRAATCVGCCPSCDGRGTGGPASAPETNGRCADCCGEGHDGICEATS